MSIITPIAPREDIPNFAPRLYGIGLLIVGIMATGAFLVTKYMDVDLARDMQGWQEKLNLIAESRTADVNQYVTGNFKELRALADNPSLQLYMAELQATKEADKLAGEPSQKSYLRNLLLFTAQRSGFSPVNNSSAIPANVQQPGKNGLAILNNQGDMLVSTVMAAASKELVMDHAKQAEAGKEALIDIRKDKDGAAYIGFTVPIFSIQGDRSASAQIGRVVGIKMLDSSFFDLLKHPGTIEKTLETVLIRSGGETIEYLSPLQDGTESLGKTVAFNADKFSEASLMQTSGSFIFDQKDYRDKLVLATSRTISGAPWALIVKIDRAEALATSDQRRASMAIFLFLIVAIITLIVFAIWWRAHSIRAVMMSKHFRRLAAKSQAQEQLLRLVSDHQPESIYMVDSDMKVHFANYEASVDSHMALESMIGKNMADVRGGAVAKRIADQCKTVMAGGHIAYDMQRFKENGKQRIVRSGYVPLAHIPVANLPNPTPGILIIEQDISEVMNEREQRLKTQRQLVETLLMLVDKRDPFASYHSKMVSQIAFEVAQEMELDSVSVETASKAGALMNIGKIVVPTELLTKTGALTTDEKRIIHDSMNGAAELLSQVSFDGPVVDTIRQWQEKWDGTGPLGMRGDDVLITARIIAVANAFVGMISPRSWRTAITIEAANKFLLAQSDEHFDRRVVVAMVNFVENHNGREWINKILEGQQKNAA
jgi:hypothetical protein